MTKTRSYFTASKQSKIAIAAVEGKLTQAQITSEYGVHATQIKAIMQKFFCKFDSTSSSCPLKLN